MLSLHYNIASTAELHCGDMYPVQDANITLAKDRVFLAETLISCPSGLRLNDGHEEVKAICAADGKWTGHDIYIDCAGE